MKTKKEFCFKGVPLNSGDIICITPAEWMADRRKISTAVLRFLNKKGKIVLEVLLEQSDAQIIGSPKLEIKENEVDSLEVVMEAREAVIYHSKERFKLYQRIIFRDGEEGSGGKVIAAYGELVAAELNLGDIKVAEPTQFHLPPPTPILTASPVDEVPLWRS